VSLNKLQEASEDVVVTQRGDSLYTLQAGNRPKMLGALFITHSDMKHIAGQTGESFCGLLMTSSMEINFQATSWQH
jgi:hypothetical protein